MDAMQPDRRRYAPAVAGAILIVVGLAVLLGRQAGFDLFESIAEAGWPLFVIIPGLILLLGAVVVRPPDGVGFAIAGTIVTTVGGILFYQQETGNWESWAYVWALIPGAAGLAMVVYGALTRVEDLVATGLRLMAISALLFVAGMWFFESVFETGSAPVDIATWWPVILIGVGVVVVARGLLDTRHHTTT